MLKTNENALKTLKSNTNSANESSYVLPLVCMQSVYKRNVVPVLKEMDDLASTISSCTLPSQRVVHV